ncbi:unnamed protein product [Allacma fusca]|uniref:C2H2-type domain-containing protein n=1 Tax=Allacma fusca TaxID=39272 RepID=A0A8J2J5I6_9HEXA|nr:unnamed protein product [Allacma fusca]
MFRTVSQIRISHHGWGESGGLDLQITFIRIITRCVGVVEELVPNIFGKFILDVTNGGSNPYFKKLFLVHSPEKSNTIVILNNVRFTDLENVLQFVYAGQVNVNQSDLSSFLQTGELLQIEGLASCSDSADEKPTGSSSTPKDHSLNVPSTSRGSTSAVAENPKRQSSPVHTPSPQGLLPAIRVGSKRFRSDDSSEISHPKSTHIGASTQVKSQDDCLDSETPIIQIRSAANLMELDPLQDNNDVSYSEGKQDPEELEETEVNFGVLKAESIEVIDVEEKDDASNLVQDMNQISDLLEDVESVSHHDILPTSCLSLPQTSSTTDSLYDAPQTRVPNRVNRGRRSKMATKKTSASASSSSNSSCSKRGQQKKYRVCPYCGGLFYKSNITRHIIAERSQTEMNTSQSLLVDSKSTMKTDAFEKKGMSGVILETVKIDDEDNDVEDEEDVVIIGSTQVSKAGRTYPQRKISGFEMIGKMLPNLRSIPTFQSCRPNLVAGSPSQVPTRMQFCGANQIQVEYVSCPICNAEVAKFALQNHMFTFHQFQQDLLDSDMRELCPHCGKYFKNKNSLKVHKSIYHRSLAARHGPGRMDYPFHCSSGHFYSDPSSQ